MTEIVLVPGAWLGGWVWDEVATRVRELPTGHWPILSEPERLAAILAEVATGAG